MNFKLDLIINIGIREENSFQLNKHIRIINTISLYGSIACLIFLLSTLSFMVPAYSLTCLACISVLMLNFYFNKIGKYDIAKGILLVIMPVIIVSFSVFIGPVGNEYYLITELVFLFFLFDKAVTRILVFSYLTSCFILIRVLIHEKVITLINPILEFVYYPNIITSFVITFIGLNLFYNEHVQYQNLVESQNEDLVDKNNEIETQKNDLKKLNNVKDKLFSIISHDLRGPLKSLQAMIDLFESKKISADQFKEQLPYLKEKIINTSNMAENLLAWSKSQLSGLEPNYQLFDLNEAINDIISVLKDNINSKNIRINVNIPPNIRLNSDQEMVKTIFRNIIHNAIKFSNPEGVIEINASEKENRIEVKIKDEGTGIEKSMVEKFNRNKTILSSKGTSGEIGTGHGLVIVKDFIEILSGKIFLESEKSKGTLFTIEFPASPDD